MLAERSRADGLEGDNMAMPISARRAVVMLAAAIPGALCMQQAQAAACTDYEKVAAMTSAKFADVQTRDYGFVYTEIVDAFPGAKRCLRAEEPGASDGLACVFEDADAAARHAAIVQEVGKCLPAWAKTSQPDPNGMASVVFTSPTGAAVWKVSLSNNAQGALEAQLRYELKLAKPVGLPASGGK
jgi:hypothetical protein